MALRNWLFDRGILPALRSSIFSIGVGNLSMGGTGKSVVVMYLIKTLQEKNRMAVLSRGYGRKTKGLLVGDSKDSAATLGDEPFQFMNRYPKTRVVVSEKRTLGIKAIEAMKPIPEIIVCDDVMQHRWVSPHLMIMTTSFENPFSRDFIFPVGGLRESRSGVKRAAVVLITKTPEDFSPFQKAEYLREINIKAPVLFTKIRYEEFLIQNDKPVDIKILSTGFLLVTGIADTSHLTEYLEKQYGPFDHMKFGDHHSYTAVDGSAILDRAGGKIILTTEKDHAKLQEIVGDDRLYCLRIALDFVFQEERKTFDQLITAV